MVISVKSPLQERNLCRARHGVSEKTVQKMRAVVADSAQLHGCVIKITPAGRAGVSDF